MTRGIPPPDPHFLSPLSSTEYVNPPQKNTWLRHWFRQFRLAGWLFGWLARLFSNVDEVWSVKVLHFIKQSYATGSNTPMRSGCVEMGCNMLLENFFLFLLNFLIITRLYVPIMAASEGRRKLSWKRKPKWNTLFMSTTLKWHSVRTELNTNSKCLCLNFHLCLLQILTLLRLL